MTGMCASGERQWSQGVGRPSCVSPPPPPELSHIFRGVWHDSYSNAPSEEPEPDGRSHKFAAPPPYTRTTFWLLYCSLKKAHPPTV